MKFFVLDGFIEIVLLSLPVRGAWIEIGRIRFDGLRLTPGASLPVRGAWIEIQSRRGWKPSGITSLPVRGAWIEIMAQRASAAASDVAPRAGSVD